MNQYLSDKIKVVFTKHVKQGEVTPPPSGGWG